MQTTKKERRTIKKLVDELSVKPERSNDRLRKQAWQYLDKIRPVGRGPRNSLFEIKIGKGQVLDFGFNMFHVSLPIRQDLKIMGVYLTDVSIGFPGVIKLSYAEAIDQMPINLLRNAAAIELCPHTFGPEVVIIEDLDVYQRVPIIVYKSLNWHEEDVKTLHSTLRCHDCGHTLENHDGYILKCNICGDKFK